MNPSSGEIVYDWFHDAPSRSHLELCLLHVDPVELLLPHTLTTQTSRLIEQTHGLVVISENLQSSKQMHLMFSTGNQSGFNIVNMKF